MVTKNYTFILFVLMAFYTQGQNVGIGTPNPESKLDVRGDVSLNDFQLRLKNGSDGNHWIGWVGGVVDGAKIVGHSGVVINNSAADQDVAFFQRDYAYFGFNPGTCCIGYESAKIGKGRNNDGTVEFMNNGWGRLGGSNGLALWANGNADVDDNPHMLISRDGNVGIGNTNPSNGRLHVSGVGNGGYYAYGWLNSGGGTGSCGSCLSDYSIWADGRIRATEFNAMSDERVKKINGLTKTSELLTTINKLKVTNYSYIDKIEHGATSKEGFIAQEIEEIIPTAVSKSQDFIPNIFSLVNEYSYDNSTKILVVSSDNLEGIVKGDIVKIITDKGPKEVTISSVNENSISFSFESSPKSLFIYGKKVDDFRAVDYDQLFSIGIGAIQELSKQNEELKSQLASAREKISEIDDLKASVKKLESIILQTAQVEK